MANIVLHADTLQSDQSFPVTFLADFDSDAKKKKICGCSQKNESGARWT